MVAVANSAATALAEQMEQIVLKRIEDDRLVLPSLPAAAAKCLEAIQSPRFSLRDAGAILERDPVVAAQLIKRANSAAMARSNKASCLGDAVSRIGSKKLKTFLMEVSARQLFTSKNAKIAEACNTIWEHSVGVGMVARDLIALSDDAAGTDAAYLAGLLHDVGKPVVASMLLEAERVITKGRGSNWVDVEAWMSIIDRSHRNVGMTLARKWNLPKDVIDCLGDLDDYDSVNRHVPANYVRFANAVVKREGIAVGKVDVEDASTLIMIGRSVLGIEDDILAGLTTDLRQKIGAQLA